MCVRTILSTDDIRENQRLGPIDCHMKIDVLLNEVICLLYLIWHDQEENLYI